MLAVDVGAPPKHSSELPTHAATSQVAVSKQKQLFQAGHFREHLTYTGSSEDMLAVLPFRCCDMLSIRSCAGWTVLVGGTGSIGLVVASREEVLVERTMSR